MKGFARLMAVVVVVAMFAAACSKDKDNGSITLDNPAIFFAKGQTTESVGFSLHNVKTLSITSHPKGWAEPVLDLATRTITVTAPSIGDQDSGAAVKSGSILMAGKTPGGTYVSASLFVGIVSTQEIVGAANSYIVTKPMTNYLFDATRKGDGSPLATDHVEIIWQSKSSLIQYLGLEEGKASFYIGSESDDETLLKSGNALLGAYDAAGNLIWSWHIWVTDYNPDADGGSVELNGYTVMSRNLGAFNNANSTSEEILNSYGLYYQWGRKDPFIGPDTYRAAKGDGAAMYNARNNRVLLKMVASSETVGTMEYALKNPMLFITGVEGSKNDWLWTPSNNLWGEDDNIATKSVNDPCPYGWRVAPSKAFDGLSISDDLNAGFEPYYDKYGWTLTDGQNSSLFIGAGRRRYDNGKILNVYNPLPLPVRSEAMEAQPWEGLYWTTAVSDRNAAAFYFWFNKQNVPGSGVANRTPYARANGMQVRCVKIQDR